MKIAFILSHPTISPSNGVVSQAETWQRGLEEGGHTVDMIDMWKPHKWESYDLILYFGYSSYMREHITYLHLINPNIVVAPILDPDYSVLRLKLYSKWGCKKLNLTNQYHSLSSVKSYIKLFLARSLFEKKYLTEGFGVAEDKCKIIRLSYNHVDLGIRNEKEDFCFHVSLLTDARKNVRRLIEAAKKYRFKLVLAGKLRSRADEERLKTWIGGSGYVEYKGFLSDEELIDHYSRARVFALPSLNEGVGIVGLEAAAMGCDIVVTSLGGPKEYYNGMAKVVNPYSVDEIGMAVTQFLQRDTYQPSLCEYVRENYSLSHITTLLEAAYNDIIR